MRFREFVVANFGMDYLQIESESFGRTGGGPAGKRRRNCCQPEEFTSPVRQRSQANARERDRTHSLVHKNSRNNVNSAYTMLRTLIPTEPKDRKLSKIETLRLASSYISHLGTQLLAGPIEQPCLRISRHQLENLEQHSRNSVCTFCIAHKKTPKSSNLGQQDEFLLCSNSLENPIFFQQDSIEIGTDITSASDLYF